MRRCPTGPRPRRLALALLGGLFVGCGSKPAPAPAVDRKSDGPPPTTERARKAAAFDEKLKLQTRRD